MARPDSTGLDRTRPDGNADYFGLSAKTVMRMIESLPGAAQLRKPQFAADAAIEASIVDVEDEEERKAILAAMTEANGARRMTRIRSGALAVTPQPKKARPATESAKGRAGMRAGVRASARTGGAAGPSDEEEDEEEEAAAEEAEAEESEAEPEESEAEDEDEQEDEEEEEEEDSASSVSFRLHGLRVWFALDARC